MRAIYIDTEYRCHVNPGAGLTAVETSFFDGKTDAYIEGYRYVPACKSWTDSHGISYTGEMVCPAVDYAPLAVAQQENERAALAMLNADGAYAPTVEAQAVRAAIDSATAQLGDAQADELACLFRAWEVGIAYQVGDRRQYDGALFKCLQAHTAQAGWMPPNTPALWAATSTEEWPLIPNPIPSMSPWMLGQKGRTADGRKWQSLIDNNVWQPTAYPQGWKECLP